MPKQSNHRVFLLVLSALVPVTAKAEVTVPRFLDNGAILFLLNNKIISLLLLLILLSILFFIYLVVRTFKEDDIKRANVSIFSQFKRVLKMLKNYRFYRYENRDGWSMTWKNGTGKRYFSVDSHYWSGMNRWYKKYHFHNFPDTSVHRPWQRYLATDVTGSKQAQLMDKNNELGQSASIEWKRFQQQALPLMKLYRNDYLKLHGVYFKEMNLHEPVVADIINWLYEKPMKKYLDAEISKGFKDEYDQLVDVVEQSQSFEEANIGSHKIFRE